MLTILKYSDRYITLRPYNTEIERDLLLYTSDKYDLDIVLKLLKSRIESNVPMEELSYDEKLNIILNLRNISVGEAFSFICTCSSCSKKYDFDAHFIDTLTDCEEIPPIHGIKFKEAFSSDYQKYTETDLDELDVNIYDEVIEHLDKHKISFDFTCKSKCPFCNTEGIIRLTEEHLISNLSDDTLSNFYQVISNMVYFGNYTLQDINQMLPFERSIYLGLLNKNLADKKTALGT